MARVKPTLEMQSGFEIRMSGRAMDFRAIYLPRSPGAYHMTFASVSITCAPVALKRTSILSNIYIEVHPACLIISTAEPTSHFPRSPTVEI